MTDRDSTTRTRARTPGEEDYPPSTAVYWRVTDPTLSGIFVDTNAMHEGRRQTNTGPAHAGSRLKLSDALGRRRPKCHPSSRTGENPPYGMIGGSRRRRHHSKPGPLVDPTRLPLAAVSRCSNTGVQRPDLLDHLVGELLEVQRHVEAKHLGGLEVDHQLELYRNLNGKLARLLTAQDAVGIGGSGSVSFWRDSGARTRLAHS